MKLVEKIVRLVDHNSNCLSWDGVQVLEDILIRMKKGTFPKKVILIGLDDDATHFAPQWVKAGMLNHEALALIDIVKAELRDMLK